MQRKKEAKGKVLRLKNEKVQIRIVMLDDTCLATKFLQTIPTGRVKLLQSKKIPLAQFGT